MSADPWVTASTRRVPAGEGEGEALVLRYEVTNPFAEELLVFDRAEDGDLDWMDVTLAGGVARLSRAWVAAPEAVIEDEAPVPWGRLVAPGATRATEVKLPLPLEERGPWLDLLREDDAEAAESVVVEALELALGWCVLFDRGGLPEGLREPVERDGETLFPLPASLVGPAQQVLVVPVAGGPLAARRGAGEGA